jgi:hypothetical protein
VSPVGLVETIDKVVFSRVRQDLRNEKYTTLFSVSPSGCTTNSLTRNLHFADGTFVWLT